MISSYGLVGVRTQDNAKDFKQPVVIAYYAVDYKKNPKGTNFLPSDGIPFHLVFSLEWNIPILCYRSRRIRKYNVFINCRHKLLEKPYSQGCGTEQGFDIRCQQQR